MRFPTSTLKRTVSTLSGAVPRIANRANVPFGIIPPDHVIAWPVRDWAQPSSASAPTLTRAGSIERCAFAAPARTSALKTEVPSDNHALDFIRPFADLE